jgi:hypothetical protein
MPTVEMIKMQTFVDQENFLFLVLCALVFDCFFVTIQPLTVIKSDERKKG